MRRFFILCARLSLFCAAVNNPSRLHTFDEVLQALDAVERSTPKLQGSWSLAQVLGHCAQSIEYSLNGYPKLKPAWFRATVGPLVKRRFLGRGEMSHDLEGAIEGAPLVDPNEPLREVISRLRSAIAKFRAHSGPLAPHLAYGACSRDEYEKLHAMHIANHFSRFTAPG
jgi:hypothetical protein